MIPQKYLRNIESCPVPEPGVYIAPTFSHGWKELEHAVQKALRRIL